MSSEPHQQQTTQQWLAVIALACAAFIVNTTEFVPVALLSDIGRSFNLASTHVGLMITVYAWVVASMSLPIMLWTKNIERRFLLFALFGLFILGHALSYIAWNFEILLVSRVAIALAHALFWSITASLAVRVAPAGKQFQALGLLSTGTAMAMVLGIPLGRIIGEYSGWRNSFAIIGLCAAIVCLILAKTLPKLPSQNSGNLHSLKLFLQRPALLVAFALTVLMVTAQFTVYSYIEPFSLHIAQFSSAQTTQFLFIYGAAGFLGSYLFGLLAPRFPHLVIPVCCLSLALSLLLFLPLSLNIYAFTGLGLFWGMTMISLSLALRAKILDLSSDATDVAMAIFSALYNVGIGGGALLGASIAHDLGLEYMGWIAASIAILGTVLAYYLTHLQRRV
ncbi:sugar transporter [Acinetobacter rudis]|uniref:sugar transporter n=1 Tax=Acinetobacter rudis TaxID=632955 RepID=UPI00333E848B